MRRPEGGLDVAAGSGTIGREEDASQDCGPAARLARLCARGLQPERGAERAAAERSRSRLDYWLRHIVQQDGRPKTYQGYESVARRHLIPGRKRLAKLSAQDVRVFITHVRQECQCCKHGWDSERGEPRCCAIGQCCESRLSGHMVQSIHAVLRNALESAVREEIIARNVAKLVKVPALVTGSIAG